MKIVRVNRGKTLGLPFRLLAVGITFFSIQWLMNMLEEPVSIIVSMLVACFLPATWFASDILIIDAEKNQIFDGVWTMGMKWGKSLKYDTISAISIERVETKPTLFVLPNKQEITSTHEFQAFAILDDNQKIFLISHPLEERLQEKIVKIKQKLDLL